MTDYPSMPPVAAAAAEYRSGPPPRSLHPVIYLLVANFAASVLLTVLVLTFRHSVIDFQVAHARLTDNPRLSRAEQLDIARKAAEIAVWSRVVGNIVLAVVYVFLVRSLLRGRRRAYRRVLLLSIAGIISLAFLWINPYPSWMRVEQVLQAFLLAAILYRVTRPEVRAYFAKKPKA